MATDTDSTTLEQFKSSGKGKFLHCVNYSLRNIYVYYIIIVSYCMTACIVLKRPTHQCIVVGFAAKQSRECVATS